MYYRTCFAEHEGEGQVPVLFPVPLSLLPSLLRVVLLLVVVVVVVVVLLLLLWKVPTICRESIAGGASTSTILDSCGILQRLPVHTSKYRWLRGERRVPGLHGQLRY